MNPSIHTTRRSTDSGIHLIFEWDKATGWSCDRVNYGPYGVSSSSWIVPGTIDEEEEEESDDE